MRDAYGVAKVRAAEAALMAKLPEGTLMQRAAAGLASVCAGLLRGARGGGRVYGSHVVVLVGTGDNGGDALYAGALLARRGAVVTAILTGPRAHVGGRDALRAAGGRIMAIVPWAATGSAPEPRSELAPPIAATRVDLPGLPPAAAEDPLDVTRPDIGRVARYAPGHEVRHAIGHADLILDGLLGIGGRGGLRDPYATLAQLADSSSGVVVAVDLPSGIDADTGAVDGPAVRADVTVTFGAIKPGLLIDPGSRHAGVVELADIGLGQYLDRPDARAPQAADIAALIPRPGPDSDKYRRGVIGLLVGSERFTGAAVLATGGAVQGGAGMVRVVTAERAAGIVRQAWPEAVITELAGALDFPGAIGRVQAWVAGPGMGVSDDSAGRLAAVLSTGLPALIDADGLTLLARQPGLLPRSAPTLLTPHAGELGRLLSENPADVESHRVKHARAAAKKFGACVLLKGSTTIIAPPDDADAVLINLTGTPWLATAGTGDVLSGLAGALLAQGLLPRQAAIVAAYLHGLAARLAASGGQTADGPAGETGGERLIAGAPIGASDVLRALPLAFRALCAA